MLDEGIDKPDIALVFQDLEMVEVVTDRIKNVSNNYKAIPLKDFCIHLNFLPQ